MQSRSLLMMSVIVASIALSATSFASMPSYSLTNFLTGYLPSTTVASSSYFNQSVGAASYVIVQLNGTGSNYLVVRQNSPTNYTLVNDTTTIYSVLKPYFTANFKINQTLISQLNASLGQFEPVPALYNITDALTETGLTAPNASCTLQNACMSCQFSPVCRTVMNYAGGVYSPFGYGIVNLSIDYKWLNSSYVSYRSALANLSAGTVGNNVGILGNAIANIYNASIALPQNPLFAFSSNFDHSLLSTCSIVGNPLTMQWYCQENLTGPFVGAINFNYTAFQAIQSEYGQLSASPVTDTSIVALSSKAAVNANLYITGLSSAQQNATFDAFLANATVKYNTTYNNAVVLLKTYPNASLSAEIATMQSVFSSVKAAGPGQNITNASATLYAAISNVSTLYSQMFQVFGPVSSLSYNNTRSIARAELDYQIVPPRLAQIAYEQQKINIQLQNGNINVSTANNLLGQLRQIGQQAKSFYAPITLAGMIKGMFGGLSSALVNPSSINASVSALPLTIAIIVFIIDMAVLFAFYFLSYHRMSRSGRLKHHPRVRRAWAVLFIVLFVLVLLDTEVAYTSALSANSFLPFTGFLSALKGSNVAFVAYNSSSSLSNATAACVSSIEKTLQAQGKAVTTLTLFNYSCYSSSNLTQTGTKCYAPILSAGKPVLLIDDKFAGTAYKGMYGNVFHANASVASGGGCTISKVLS